MYLLVEHFIITPHFIITQSYTMMAKPMKTLELHYPMIQFLIWILLLYIFHLATQPFPHRLFTDAEMTTTLSELGLDAGGSLVVKKRDVNQLSSGKAASFLLFNHCPFFDFYFNCRRSNGLIISILAGCSLRTRHQAN